jgi:hypothetical protein
MSGQLLMGDVMKKYARFLVAITFLIGLSIAANAEIRGEIVVTLPFGFVVAGKTLPAGTYRVSRLSGEKFDGLVLTSYDKHTSVFVRPNEIESASPDKPQVSFQRVGDQNFLSTVQTTWDVYRFPVSRSVIMEATARSGNNASASASSGGN